MARSRYIQNGVIDSLYYATWYDPTLEQYSKDILDNVVTVDHFIVAGQRLDTLASIYYNDSEYWWVIALVNRIQDPFSLVVGQKLRIPLDIRPVMEKLQR